LLLALERFVFGETVPHGQHASGASRRPAPTARHRRLNPHRRPRQGIHAVLAGTAAVVAATVGGLHSVDAQARSTDASATAYLDPHVQALDAQLLRLRDHHRKQEKAAREREVRASRERARRALLEQRRRQALAARQKAAARKRAAEERLRRLARAYVRPVVNYRLTARFGASGGLWSNGHTGLDFSAPSGTPVRAVAAGSVVKAEWAGAYGWQIVIRHADGTETWYCHLSSMNVRSGGAVQPGEVVGRVGSTGNSTGPHLHLEVRVGDKPIDPAAWLGAHGVKV